MANFSEYLAKELLNHVLRDTDYTQPLVSSLYMALFTSGTDLETNVQSAEVSGNNYARTLVAFDLATSGVTQNTSDVAFPAASGGAWGTITHAAVCDALTNGQILYWAALDSNKTINDGDTFKFLTGAFIVEHQ